MKNMQWIDQFFACGFAKVVRWTFRYSWFSIRVRLRIQEAGWSASRGSAASFLQLGKFIPKLLKNYCKFLSISLISSIVFELDV